MFAVLAEISTIVGRISFLPSLGKVLACTGCLVWLLQPQTSLSEK